MDTNSPDQSILDASDTFIRRHIGPGPASVAQMLQTIGYESLDGLVDAAVPQSIRMDRPLDLGDPRCEHELLRELRGIAQQNDVHRSFIGMGYHGCITPPVIQRNILENPGWYTQYTPYQAEISQGRLEALLNFQTMISDLAALPVAGASLLDEGTAAAEAMTMCARATRRHGAFVVSADCHPQTIEVVRGRAKSQEFDFRVVDIETTEFDETIFGVLVQYPTTDGRIVDYRRVIERAHAAGAMVVMAADPLALTLLTPPGELGADIAVGSAQRFGVPMGGGGPHAAYLATREEHVRKMPGRLIGVSRDVQGNPALRMAIQTREQHIKRDRATSNICTAQVLLAVMAGMYGVYHGPDGLRRIASRVRSYALALRRGLRKAGHDCGEHGIFDTVRVRPVGRSTTEVMAAARERRMNLRDFGDGTLGVSVDETTTRNDIVALLASFGASVSTTEVDALLEQAVSALPEELERRSGFLTHEVFHSHHSETEMLRYIKRLESRDLSLAHSMIPLGSCTMKLNGTSEMLPITWAEFAHMHPFAPAEQRAGYERLCRQLETWLAEISGFAAVSLQPNAGSQGEYAGLLVIRAYHEERGDTQRDVCLIPTSAHGTNPASAITAGMKVVAIKCDKHGNIDVDDLRAKAQQHADHLAALMITYPSTHGVFETAIREICDIVHEFGGLVYMDGANMNAEVGLCRPGDIGADVCHLNLHKTFCIPHGGGGPGMGPIGVTETLKPFLPSHPVAPPAGAGKRAIGPVSAAPYGSPSILPISWVYIALMGAEGLTEASKVAILNANYMAARLRDHYDVLYTAENGTVAHEFIIDCRPFEKTAGIRIDDIAKRLMDYGFHAPTMAWPVPGTLMIEPTESEPKAELDRLCDALIAIRGEIHAIESGEAGREDNVLKNAPHTMEMVGGDEWPHPYTREQAAWPAAWLRNAKFWPPVARVDNPYGDRNLMCSCPSVEELAD